MWGFKSACAPFWETRQQSCVLGSSGWSLWRKIINYSISLAWNSADACGDEHQEGTASVVFQEPLGLQNVYWGNKDKLLWEKGWRAKKALTGQHCCLHKSSQGKVPPVPARGSCTWDVLGCFAFLPFKESQGFSAAWKWGHKSVTYPLSDPPAHLCKTLCQIPVQRRFWSVNQSEAIVQWQALLSLQAVRTRKAC